MVFLYRVEIPVSASADGVQTNYQMKLTIVKGTGSNSAGTIYLNNHAANWPYDIEFRNVDGDVLDYWREEYDATDMTVWVECDSIAASGETEFYLYYGDSGVSDASDGDDTFLFYDHFEGSSYDTNKWKVGSSPPTVEVASSLLHLTGVDDNWDAFGAKTASFGKGYCLAYRITTFTNLSSTYGIDTGWINAIYGIGSGTQNFQIIRHKASVGRNYNTTSADVSFSNANTAGVFSLYRPSDTSKTSFRKNSESLVDNSNQVPTENLYPAFMVTADDAVGHLYVDWVYVRKFADNEPTWATPGSEEELPTITDSQLIFPRRYRSDDDLSFLPSS